MSEAEQIHEFTLLLAGLSTYTDEIANELFEEGCDDATLSSRNGRVYLTFSRRAMSREVAIQTAIEDVNGAGQIAGDILKDLPEAKA